MLSQAALILTCPLKFFTIFVIMIKYNCPQKTFNQPNCRTIHVNRDSNPEFPGGPGRYQETTNAAQTVQTKARSTGVPFLPSPLRLPLFMLMALVDPALQRSTCPITETINAFIDLIDPITDLVIAIVPLWFVIMILGFIMGLLAAILGLHQVRMKFLIRDQGSDHFSLLHRVRYKNYGPEKTNLVLSIVFLIALSSRAVPACCPQRDMLDMNKTILADLDSPAAGRPDMVGTNW